MSDSQNIILSFYTLRMAFESLLKNIRLTIHYKSCLSHTFILTNLIGIFTRKQILTMG